jgi:hypothetical protein
MGAGEGDVNDRLRVPVTAAAEFPGDVVESLAPEVNGPKDGMNDATDDHRLAAELPVVVVAVGEGGGGVCGGGEGGKGLVIVQGGGVTGLNHLSTNLITGIKELIVACVFVGELGNVR